jgi:transcriptional regulator with XRE-family HTH domain
MDFSERLKTCRLALNFSQSELAQKTGISERTIYSYEQLGKFPRGGNVLKLADALDVSPSYLLGRADKADEKNSFLIEVREKFGSRGSAEAEELLRRTSALFAGGEIDETSKDAFFRSLMEVYLESKQEAAAKFGAKNKRKKRSQPSGQD